jgi:hypothetical protein
MMHFAIKLKAKFIFHAAADFLFLMRKSLERILHAFQKEYYFAPHNDPKLRVTEAAPA